MPAQPDPPPDPIELLMLLRLFGLPVPEFAILANVKGTGPAQLAVVQRRSRSKPHRMHVVLVDPEARIKVSPQFHLDLN